jgi:hypothetical protein
MALNDRTARYFDLINESQTLKRINGIPLADSEFKNFHTLGKTIPVDWDVSFGDVLNWSKGRPTEAYFVIEDRRLLKNPDRTGSGYLTIPFLVTSKIKFLLIFIIFFFL